MIRYVLWSIIDAIFSSFTDIYSSWNTKYYLCFLLPLSPIFYSTEFASKDSMIAGFRPLGVSGRSTARSECDESCSRRLRRLWSSVATGRDREAKEEYDISDQCRPERGEDGGEHVPRAGIGHWAAAELAAGFRFHGHGTSEAAQGRRDLRRARLRNRVQRTATGDETRAPRCLSNRSSGVFS